MNNKQTLQNIWSITDKPLIDMMKSKCSATVEDDSDDSSESDLEDSSEKSFIAVPREFRPNLPPHLANKKHGSSEFFPNQKPINYGNNSASKCPSVRCKQTKHPNSATEVKKYETSSQKVKKNNIQGNVKRNNNKIVRHATASKIKQEKAYNSTSFVNPDFNKVSTLSKNTSRRNKIQYEYVRRECGTIQINFDLLTEKKSILKEGLKYEAIILENENKNSHLKTTQNNFEHETPIKGDVKWDSSLSLTKQNDNKIENTIINQKETKFTPNGGYKYTTGKNNKQFNTKSNLTNFNRVKKPFDGNSKESTYNSNLEENNFNVQKKIVFEVKKLENNFVEKENNLETPFYRDNVQLDNKKNCLITKIENSKLNTRKLNTMEDFAYQCSSCELNTACNQRKYPNLSNLSVEKILQEFNQEKKIHTKSNSSDYKKEEIKELKSIFDYGKDISDLVIGSYTALTVFISLHKEWKTTRQQLIEHFELLEKNLKGSSQQFIRYRDVINIANAGATIASTIPHPYVSIAGKIVSFLTSLFTTLENKPKKGTIKDINEIVTCLFKDIHASTEFYMHGLQCNEQFEETTKLIEEFHSTAAKYQLFEIENSEIVKFVQNVLEYKPTHRIFYKKLQKCFLELMDKGSSSDAKKLCEPFVLCMSPALDVIGHLNWRFPKENFNNESVKHELEQLLQLIQDSNSTTLKDLAQRIQNCNRTLNEELILIERSLRDITLFNTFPEQSLTKHST